jgi:ESCRT-I complex subunit MVB12
MADSLLERKDRFVCITRLWPLSDLRTLAGDRALVLEDIRLINERDNPPANYTTLAYTIDTREKGTVKRLICVKMVERQGGMKCICDIIFLYRTKRPPQFYTLIGDINGLQMCVREGTVPPINIPPPSSSISEPQSRLYPNAQTGQTSQQFQRQVSDYSNTNTLSKKTDEKEILDDIPFQINKKYLNGTKSTQNGYDLDSFKVLTHYDIEQKFNYDFNIERSIL